jgi:DnaJ homolog subfamily B member 11
MDPFASFFGDFGFGFGGQEQRNEVHKGANIVMDLYASLEEMYSGNFVEVMQNPTMTCPSNGNRNRIRYQKIFFIRR